MKAVADTVGVARSNLVERLGRVPGARRPYTKPADRALLPLLRKLLDERSSYGYDA
jgi:hypothetical protein